MRWKLWIEYALAAGSAGLCILTLVWHEWIEAVFGVDPDAGNGAVEWAFVIGLAVAAIAFGMLARRTQQVLRASASLRGGATDAP